MSLSKKIIYLNKEGDYHLTDLIELLYRQHKQLRQITETIWNENNKLHLTSSEWYVLKNIYEGRTTVSELMEQIDISKQGVHKFLVSLEEKNLITTELKRTNKLQKISRLTDQGLEVIQKSKDLESEIETMVRNTIGNEQYSVLHDILQSPLVKDFAH